MNFDEYKKKLKELEETYHKERKDLVFNYVMSNNIIKIGDVIEDFRGTRIKVDRISIDNGAVPQCAYQGFEITKQGKPYKDRRREVIWQKNIKRRLT